MLKTHMLVLCACLLYPPFQVNFKTLTTIKSSLTCHWPHMWTSYDGHLSVSSGTWQGFQLGVDIKTSICYNEIGPFAHNVLTILGSIVNMVGRVYVIIWREKNIHFDFLYFKIINTYSTPNVKICLKTIPNLIQKPQLCLECCALLLLHHNVGVMANAEWLPCLWLGLSALCIKQWHRLHMLADQLWAHSRRCITNLTL